MFKNTKRTFLVLISLGVSALTPIAVAKAQPSQEESLEFINSYCSSNQMTVENGILKSAGMAFVPANQKGDEFWGITTVSLDLSKVVLGLVRRQVVIGTVAYAPEHDTEVFNAYSLKCKTQNCATFTPPKEYAKIGTVANAVVIPDVPEIGVKYLNSCVRAFQHLSKLNGAKDPASLFGK